jgi:predicted dehydrogenase
VGIVGCGAIAGTHADAYLRNPRVELVGVSGRDHARTTAFAMEHRTRAHAGVKELVAQGVDLVSVTTPPGSHAGVAAELLGAGCSVLLEKPPTISLAELDDLAAAERESPGSVYVVFQHRFGSGADRARRLMAAGALGVPRVALCETLWYRPEAYFRPAWRGNWAGEGGGPTLGHGIHQIDLMLQLMGEWESLHATAARLARPVEFEDVSMAVVRFADGAVASVVNSLLSPRELSRIRIDTTAGTLEVNHVYGYGDADWSWFAAPGEVAALANGRNPGSVAAGPRGERPRPEDDVWTASAGVDRRSGHVSQIDELVDDLLARRPHSATLASTRSTMEVVTALYASAFERTIIHRSELTPVCRFYANLHGGSPAVSGP